MRRVGLVLGLILVAVVAALFVVRSQRLVQTQDVVAPLSDDDTLQAGDGGHIVVVRAPDATQFHVSFVWPLGFRDDPQICSAVHAWWLRSASWRETEKQRGIEVVDPICGWAHVSLDLTAPATELSQAIPPLFDHLAQGPGPAPSADEAAARDAQVQSFVTWAGITSGVRGKAVLQHALFGPRDRTEWFPRRGQPDEAAIVASLRRLVRTPVDVRYAGPHDLAAVTEAVHRERDERSAAPVLQLDADRADVYLWTDERMAIDLTLAVGQYRADEEALYALFTHWTKSRVDAATSYLPRTDNEYGVNTTFEPSLWDSGQNVVVIHAYKRAKRTLDAPHLLDVLRGVIDSTSLTDAEWHALVEAVRIDATKTDADGVTRAGRVADGMRRGLPGDPNTTVLQQLPTVSKVDFEAYLRTVAASPTTIIAGGKDGPAVADFPAGTEVVSVPSR